MYRSWGAHCSDLPEGRNLDNLHDLICAGGCHRKLVGCRSGDNLFVKVDKPIKGDVGGVDVQVIGLRGRVRGNHRLGLVVGRRSYLSVAEDEYFVDLRPTLTVAQSLGICAAFPTLLSISKLGPEMNVKR